MLAAILAFFKSFVFTYSRKIWYFCMVIGLKYTFIIFPLLLFNEDFIHKVPKKPSIFALINDQTPF